MSLPLIGVRDSGVGGLTVAREIRRLMPHHPLLYFADTAHVPYGDREPAEVRHFALEISNFLIENGAAIVVFACNTTSAYALTAARARFDVPIFGMIAPGAVAAQQLTRNQRVGVLATDATVNSGVYSASLLDLMPACHCVEIGCPEFVPLVEAEQTDSIEARQAAQRYLQPLLADGVDTVVLGCTHYPMLLPVLQSLAPAVRFIDPARAVALEVANAVQRLAATAGPETGETGDRFFASGPSEGVRHWIGKLLALENPNILPGPVFEMAQPVATQAR